MCNLTYVSSNLNKYVSVKEHFLRNEIDVDFFECDLFEPEINDIEIISKTKAMEAYEKLGRPCFVADSGFYIDHYPEKPGYPGAFAKRSGVSSDVLSLLKTMENVCDRTCRFVDCLTFYDGEEFYSFYGVSEGSLAYSKRGDNAKKAKSNLWYVFVPRNCQKTLAEMSDEEREQRLDGHTSATEIFIEWYKTVYCKKEEATQIKKSYAKQNL